MTDDESERRVRVDKWLWAARFFKSRSLATEGVGGGKVEVNGERAKPARLIKIGDQVRVRVGPDLHTLNVRALSERRGPAAAARLLYEETPESMAERERMAEQRRIAPAPFTYEERGRPTKKDRRELGRFIDRQRKR